MFLHLKMHQALELLIVCTLNYMYIFLIVYHKN